MKTDPKIPEEILYKIWEEKKFDAALSTSEGAEIEILDCGVRNLDNAGPDYLHAKIRIGSLTFAGDVEVDVSHSDWKAHGHNLNSRYNKVILHVILNNDSDYPYVVTQSGRKVPTLELNKFLNVSINETLQQELIEAKDELKIKMPCSTLNQNLERREKLNFIKSLGLLRFRKKCERNIERLKELILLESVHIKEPKVLHDFHKTISEHQFIQTDFENPVVWNQLLYEQIFEALGYSKNKDAMLKLSNNVDYKFFKSLHQLDPDKIESILFHISGLYPQVTDIDDEETSAYLRKGIEHWDLFKDKYDSDVQNFNQWHFYKLRPQNFPTLRLAAGARILHKIINQELFVRLLNHISHINDTAKLVNKLRNDFVIKAEGYWADYYNFNKKSKVKLNYFIGVGRADEIIINILLPVYSVYFELNNKKELSQKVLEFYFNFYQKEGNHLVDQVNDTLGFKNEKFRSVYYQGMIDLFRNYCIKSRCMECEIGKKVFN